MINRRFIRITLGIGAVVFLGLILRDLFRLTAGTYVEEEGKLMRIDHLSVRTWADGSGARYEFQDSSKHWFVVRTGQYLSIPDNEGLDSIMRRIPQFVSVLVDEEGFRRFHSSKTWPSIRVYQIYHNNEPYIDMGKANARTREYIISIVFFSIACATICLLFYSVLGRKHPDAG